MNLTCSFSTVNPAAADVDLLVVPVYANGELGPGAEVVAAAFAGAISDYMAAAGFAGKPGQILRVPVSGLKRSCVERRQYRCGRLRRFRPWPPRWLWRGPKLFLLKPPLIRSPKDRYWGLTNLGLTKLVARIAN